MQNVKEILKLESLITAEKYSAEERIEVINSLEYLFKKTPAAKLDFTFVPGHFSLRVTEKHGTSFTEEQLVLFARNLLSISGDKGIDSILEGLGNPTQFRNTVFEVECACFCKNQKSVQSIELGQEVQVGKSKKKPEFVLNTEVGEFICECKSLQTLSHEESKKFSQKADAIIKLISPMIEGYEDYRIEVHYAGSPGGNPLKNLKYLREQIEQALVKNDHSEISIEEFRAKILSRQEPIWFTQWHHAKGVVTVGPVAVNVMDISNCRVRVSTLNSKLRKKTENLIRDAISQIPSDKNGIIFIEASNKEQTLKAAESFMSNPAYTNIKAVILNCGEWRMVNRSTELPWMKRALSAFSV